MVSFADPAVFSSEVLGRPLRAYQVDPLRVISRGVVRGDGLVYTVMYARQMGKNELSAHLEAYLLNLYSGVGGTIVKAAPTFKPQVILSKARLEGVLSNWLNVGKRRGSWGYITQLGMARVVFFSGERGANVVGETASLLLEIDEAQSFDPEKYQRDFRPMCSSANACTVLYGTAWAEDDLLALQKAANMEAQARDGRRRHFEADWTALASVSPEYGAFVESERMRLGPEHPLFLTQYCLRALPGAGRLFTPAQVVQMRGDWPRIREPWADGRSIVAGLDVAGEGVDRTVLTLAEVEQRTVGGVPVAVGRVVEHLTWRGVDLAQLQLELADVLGRVWRVRRVAVDATGLGAGVASFLRAALGDVVEEVVIGQVVKSRLGYDLLAAVGAGRLRVYSDDGSEESGAFWREVALCKREMIAGQTLRWYVPAGEGHDDFVVSLALAVRALDGFTCTPAASVMEADDILQWRV